MLQPCMIDYTANTANIITVGKISRFITTDAITLRTSWLHNYSSEAIAAFQTRRAEDDASLQLIR